MKFQIFTMYVNGPDLLEQALNGLGRFVNRTVVLDNSRLQELEISGFPGEVYRPQVPLFCAQSYNLINALARERQMDYFFIMHSDAIPTEDTVVRMLELANRLDQECTPWAVMFSTYDVLCLHKTHALKDFRWDPYLPLYFTDVDFYRRIRLCGLHIIESGLSVGHADGGSSTLKKDPILHRFIQINYGAWHEYYINKWGGSRDQETFTTPFNSGEHSLLFG